MSHSFTKGQRTVQTQSDSIRLADAIAEGAVHSTITDEDRKFIEDRDMFFLATVDADGRVHRGVGDVYVDQLLSDDTYAEVRERILSCGAEGYRQVWEHGPYGTEVGERATDLSESCWDGWITNASWHRGAGLSLSWHGPITEILVVVAALYAPTRRASAPRDAADWVLSHCRVYRPGWTQCHFKLGLLLGAGLSLLPYFGLEDLESGLTPVREAARRVARRHHTRPTVP